MPGVGVQSTAPAWNVKPILVSGATGFTLHCPRRARVRRKSSQNGSASELPTPCSTAPTHVCQSRSPLRCTGRSGLRWSARPLPAPSGAALVSSPISSSLRRCAAKSIISRRKVASADVSGRPRRPIVSPIIVAGPKPRHRRSQQPNLNQDHCCDRLRSGGQLLHRQPGRHPMRSRPSTWSLGV